MWLSQYVTGNSFVSDHATVGEVAGTRDQKVSVNATVDYRGVPIAAPYGVVSVPLTGASTVVMPTEAGQVCVGVIAYQSQDLQPGEVMLYSSGGASIVLKNDGRVLINGKAVE